MSSGLLPSPLLLTLSNLSQKEEVSLISHGKYLNLEKYKKGKKFYVAFLESLPKHKNVQKHNKFINSFEKLNYVHQMLLVSSMKYYQDIKQLLFGTENDEEILKHELIDFEHIESVIKELSNIIKRGDRTSIENSEASINRQSSIESLSESQEKREEVSYRNDRFDKDENSKSLIDFLDDEDEELRSFLDSELNDSVNPTDFSYSLVRPRSSSVADYDKIVDNPNSQFIRLIKVEDNNCKNETVSIKTKSERTHLTANESNLKVSEVSEKYLNRIYHVRLTSNLALNDLYARHHQPKEKKTYEMSPLKINKKRKSSQLGSKICDKLIKCLRSFGLFKQRKQKNEDETFALLEESPRKKEGGSPNKLFTKSESGKNIHEH